MKTVGVVGYGYVGKAMERFFARRYEVHVYDPALGYKDHSAVRNCDVGVICVPTPALPNGRCDTIAVVEEALRLQCELVVVKSTVEPGTTDHLAGLGVPAVFSPEFLGEPTHWTPHKWVSDVVESPFYIFGGDPKLTAAAVDLYLPVAGPNKVYRQTSALVAEIAKYTENSFLATKVAFCHEVEQICRRAGVDYREVREAWLLDPRTTPDHTAVFPGCVKPFGQKCLPKDLAAFVSWASSSGYTPELLAEVIRSNDRIGRLRTV